ncbi:hypothetical protein P22_3564 [Propionispora sp. 2/2-37]|uniref:stage III sporulation protein AB n=1 Tax=Propionispora sp. 2/2-37 TaxID=1677858 RepID=UPI0006BB90C7|nr:stage III sporulation protein AB [Propionispora sp. 2/2-37]CUH97434.1 hypothetical protein P22_3564 [Propionispora sp. 2/2-37]
MWLKLLGSLLIIFAGTSIGCSFANRCSERPKQIRHILNCLASLRSYINYAAIPLPEALKLCTNSTEGVIRDLFEGMSGILERTGWITPKDAMLQAIALFEKNMALDKPELEMLVLLGANLGTADHTEQEKFLSMIQSELEKIEQNAIKLRDQNVKLYRYLGICGSLAVIICLV